MTNRTVKVTIAAAVTGAIANVKAFKSTLTDFGSEVDRASLKHKEAFGKIIKTTAIAGAGLVGAFGLAVKSAADFDKQMSAVASVSDSSASSMEALRAAALKAGKDTVYSATESAKAEEELAKAGISTSDILGGALTGALSLASAGSLDLADAATISAQAMNEFHLAGSDVGHIADVLAAGANTSATDVSSLGQSLNQAGLIASQTGLSLEDTVGTLAAFAQNGLAGSDAGTSFKTMLQQLQSPSKLSAGLMQELGISAYDASGNFIGITSLAQNLQDKLGQLSQAQRDSALSTIFGSDATRAASILYHQGASGLSLWIDGVNKSGAASETAKKKLDNLSGDIEQLKGSFETLAIQSGSGATGGLRTLTQAATGTLNAFLKLPAPVQAGVTILAGVSGGSLLAVTGLLKVKQTVGEAMQSLRDFGPVGEKAATAIGKIGSVAGKLTLVGIAGFAAYEGIKAFGAWVSSKSAPTAVNVEKLSQSLRDFAQDGKAAGEVAKLFGPNLNKLAIDMDKVAAAQARAKAAQSRPLIQTIGGTGRGGGGAAVGNSINAVGDQAKQAKTDLAGLDTALASVASGGGATQAKVAFDHIAESLMAQGKSMPQVEALFTQYISAAQAAGAANGGLAKGFGDVSANATTMGVGLQDAIAKGQSLTQVFDQLNGAAETSARAQVGFEQSIDDLSASFDKNGKTMDITTQKGRDNTTAVLNTVDAATKAAQAKYDETGSVQQASDTYNDYIGQLKKTLTQAHWTDAEIDGLLRTYAKMPPVVSTNVVASGLGGAFYKVSQYRATLQDINGKTYTANIKIVTHGSVTRVQGQLNAMERWGGIRHAKDGLLSLSVADLYASNTKPLYGFAEAATGGEAFVPRRGDYGRSTSILDQASRWYGGRFMPGNGGGGGGGPVSINITLTGGDASTRAIMSQIKSEVSHAFGGNVQVAMGRG
jgi:TP901 family phage tail tape measure protein